MNDNNARLPSKSFVDRSPYLANPELLREAADRDGYLFLRGLIPRERVLGLRRQILTLLAAEGLMSKEHPPMDGVADLQAVAAMPLRVDVGVSEELYKQIQKLEEFHAITHDPALLNAFGALFGEEAMPHPRNIGRIMTPHPGARVTPSHQDFIHIQGAPETWTCWFPLGDCPPELGGLSMLEGSHKLGVLQVAGNEGAGGLETLLCGLDMEWVYGGYEAGDAVVFHSQTVHRAMPNTLGNRIRLSCDNRYQRVRDIIDPSSLQPHGPYEWEELYEGWSSDRLKYYWRKHDFALSEWDESIRWQREKIC
ncbi:phytanoyl-CoA dioxygenase family protein [Cohnella fermenti]|uniref:Phytanoyl-CoA dioxygenase family protein n=1 Tax=Cohnella fermenti TaxID=2565925 RepID=A0A4S4BP04_9BACL|nr:phytanoyl-CoA dioxygenase family protein [Cohnella fermenti]THF76585.1 phytanoyl-CoA dioxygenase family protein [Cohnella fermenti]